MRYLPATSEDRAGMLSRIGLDGVEQLYADIPEKLRLDHGPQLPPAHSELELDRRFTELADANRKLVCFLGAGAYDHYIPAHIGAILGRSEFYTAYTPYQPEISQGMLQSIYEYQTSICRLTGLDASNASMYDGASALAEAALMACDITGRGRVAVSAGMHPEYRETIATYLHGQGLELQVLPLQDGHIDLQAALGAIGDDLAGLIVQTPNFFGLLEEEIPALREKLSEHKALLIVSSDPISLGNCRTPSEWGADIAAGEGQPLGLSLNFGGPYLGWLACRSKYLRRMPGRIVGATVDHDGRPCYVLTLQAREQHIRRQRASSNICSNEALMALAATVYLASL
ncbi:MAG: aminomethyl-transferring glycine dehydrogenase subunit GcvPA, partial [bacterium]|nr:aminomethyl-transferring glycine dehydrogenase subunit GcvPA [bacterium]